MAATIKDTEHEQHRKTLPKPILINKLEGCSDVVNMAVTIPHEDAILSVSQDNSIRLWIKRESGQYWPSICHMMAGVDDVIDLTRSIVPYISLYLVFKISTTLLLSIEQKRQKFNCDCKKYACSSLDYHGTSRRLFVGLASGTITEFEVSEDLNRLHHKRNYLAHMNVVTGICFSLEHEWLLSISRDKYFQLHDATNGKRLGGYQADAWCTAMEFDAESRHVFVGDYAGHISILKVDGTSLSLVTTLKGHSGSIGGLAWDAEKKLLFSGSFDQSIIIWDIGGQQGTAFELQGHMSKVQALCYAPHAKKLFSCSEDGVIMVWDMSIKRNETPEWSQCDICERCGGPFFWNFKEMWNKKTVGVRQHHCRKCGRAVCNNCSEKESTLPIMGFEYPVRFCNECYDTISDQDRTPLAIPNDGKHPIKFMHMDLTKARMLTCGGDRIVKLWDVKAILLS